LREQEQADHRNQDDEKDRLENRPIRAAQMKRTPDRDPIHRVSVGHKNQNARDEILPRAVRLEGVTKTAAGVVGGQKIKRQRRGDRPAELPTQREELAARELAQRKSRREEEFERVAATIFDKPRGDFRSDPDFEKKMHEPKEAQRDRPVRHNVLRFPMREAPHSAQQRNERPSVTTFEAIAAGQPVKGVAIERLRANRAAMLCFAVSKALANVMQQRQNWPPRRFLVRARRDGCARDHKAKPAGHMRERQRKQNFIAQKMRKIWIAGVAERRDRARD
jgi:hypothetical protein